jgi:transcription elongation factor Elf1
MPHVGPILEGRAFFCPHCGALYSATPSLVPKIEGDTAKCGLPKSHGQRGYNPISEL